ncbi:hypothetical protein FJZ33_00245 [Candidatus Poribacteria bacterium]|nr:hypothetical protein [Candidatus Poribacteria bacterium]
MPKKPLKIIGINPGTRYVGLAIFCGSELRDWQVKNMEGRWSNDKMGKIISMLSSLIDSYEANVLAVKQLNPSRSSPSLNKLAIRIENLSRMRKLRIYRYSINEVEKHFQPEYRINRKNLGEIIASEYPVLSHELRKEQANLNPYYVRMFEAVAIGSLCLYQLSKHKCPRTP